MATKLNPVILLIVALFVLPFVMWSGYYEGPKVLMFMFIGFALTSFWLFRILKKSKKVELTKIDYFYLAWLSVMVIASLLGVHPTESILGGSYRHQGILFFFTLWVTYKSIQLFTKEEKIFLSKAVGYTVLIESVIVFAQYASGNLYFNKPLGTIGEANAVAGFLAMGSYFVFWALPIEFYAFPVISILITESRSGLLAVIPNLLTIARSLNARIQKVLVLICLVAGIVFITFASLKIEKSATENRPLIWKLGIYAVSKRPFLGYGAESGEVIYSQMFSARDVDLNGLTIDRAHNLILDIAMWSGGIGLLFFSGFMTLYFKSLNSKYAKFAFVSFIIYSMFQPLSIVHWLLLILL